MIVHLLEEDAVFRESIRTILLAPPTNADASGTSVAASAATTTTSATAASAASAATVAK